MNKKLRGGHRRKKLLSRALSLVLSAAMLVGGIGMSYTTPVYAETTVSAGDVVVVDETVDTTVSEGDVATTPEETVTDTVSEGDATAPEADATVTDNDTTVSEGDVTVPEGDVVVPEADATVSEGDVTVSEGDVTVSEGDVTVSQGDAALMNLRPLSTAAFSGSATFNFGTDVTNATVFDSTTGIGFSDVEYNNAAKDWVGGVYYPRETSNNAPGASYVTNGDGYLTIASKVWTETESSGYGVYTYENTSSLDMVLDPADYTVTVTFVNPTSAEYTAYLESEDITKKSGIKVAAGAEVTESFTAILIDGTLNLKFLAASSATNIDAAATQNVYVSKVSVAKQAAREAGVKPTIYLASDSTVQTYEENVYPQTGWGQTLANFFGGEVVESEAVNAGYSQSQVYEAENVIVENRAIGGRSSKSFVDEGKLDDLLEDIKPGDYLFVQWGHNDATAARPNRYVSSADFEKWIQVYVDGAKQRGAIPVLVTPVARYSYRTNADGTLDTFKGDFEAYGDVMRKMADEQGLALIDLTARSVAVCNNFGIDGSKSLFFMLAPGEWPNYPDGKTDATHLQYYGALKFAQCVAEGIQESGNADLAGLKDKVVINKPENEPGAVTNLKKGAVGSSSIAMTWDAAEGAELYYIYRQALTDGQTIDDVDFSNAQKYSVSASAKYTDSSCEAGTTYVYAVRGFNEKGLGEFSEKIEVATKTAGWRFDINCDANSVTEPGWTGVLTEKYGENSEGWGWITYPGPGRDRGEQANIEYVSMARDFTFGEGEFALDIPNGDYEVTVYGGDILPGTSTQKTAYSAEGKSLGTISVKTNIQGVTGTARVLDGTLNIGIHSAGNTLIYFNGFTVTEILKAPASFEAGEVDIDATTGAANWLISFNGVEEAVSYNIYAKNSTDTDFKCVKSFTVEEYAADDLACRAMAGDAGETYELYITCVAADGTESARSNIFELKTVEEGPIAAAPQNLVCTSPSADATQLQKSISLKWDAVEGAFKYIIYRSTRLEDEKGYTGFEKVGESKTTTFTDEDDVATNIHYYYKVAAMTVTGLGEMSEICTTPITGTMVASAREKYTDRALVAINLAGADGGETVVTATDDAGNEYTSGVYVSWRSFEADLDADNNVTTTFTVYKNGTAIASDLKVTNLIDPSGTANDTYKVVGSNDSAIGVSAKDTAVWANKYLELNLYAPAAGITPDHGQLDNSGNVIDGNHTYEANDMSVGDLNGDGDLELIVKWYPSNAKDNSGYNCTGKTYLDGYDVDFATGKTTLLWRIDLGVNIRSGAHYTQFQVWDYDGDGKAEIAIKTADGTTTYKSTDGTVDGLVETGYVGACNSDALPVNVFSEQYDYRNASGFVLDGPEYFSIFNGEDGTKAAADAEYLPGRGSVSAWGDGYGNRVDRFLSATAYLNGETPFAVFARGYYTRTCLTAYYMKDTDGDGVGDAIDTYWQFDSNEAGTQYEAQGNHGLSINDIDNDGKDEIIYGALTLDHDGTVMYSTGLGHGDAMHVSDWVSWNEGLEIMAVHEHTDAEYHVEIHDAETGEVIMGYFTGKDTGRGVAADIDPTAEGAEWWSIASPTYEGNDEPAWDSTNGEVYSSWSTMENLIKLADSTPASNASIFWDGDLMSEIQDHTFNNDAYAPTGVRIYKWNYEEEQQEILLGSTEIWSTNGTKGNLGLVADILGDWREEIIARTSSDRNTVRIYSTTIETDYVVPCLLENLAYREGVAWQNVGYNQPANLNYLLSEGLVTAELLESEATTPNEVEILFTPANDGNLFGHDITAYKVYRAAADGEFELIDTVDVADLETVVVDGGRTETDTITKVEQQVVKTYVDMSDVSTVKKFVTTYTEDFEDGTADFTAISAGNDSISAEVDGVKNPNTSKNFYSVIGGSGGRGSSSKEYNISADGTIVQADFRLDAAAANQDTVFALMGSKETANWLSAGTQILTIKGTTGTTSSDNGYYASFTINGVDIKDKAVVNEASKIKLDRNSTGWLHLEAELDFTNKVVDVKLTRISDNSVIYEGELPFADASATTFNSIYLGAGKNYGVASVDNVQIGTEKDVLITHKLKETYSEDFEDGTADFTAISAGNDSISAEVDGVTNPNTSKNFYSVIGGSGGRGSSSKEYNISTDGTVVEADFRLDAAAANQDTVFALMGSKETANWLSAGTQILTIKGTTGTTSSDNGYYASFTINGVDIKDKAVVNEASKIKLDRNSTGWLHLKAEFDFTNKVVDVKLTRNSDNSVVYEGELAFADASATTFNSIYLGAGKNYGVASVDNVKIGTLEQVEVTKDFVTTYTEDFEDGTADFTAISAGNDSISAEVDGVKNPNTSKNFYSVIGGSGGRGSSSKEYNISADGTVVQADFRLDAAAANQDTVFALMGSKETANWLSAGTQILTIKGTTGTTSSDNGYYASFTINGVDIKDKVVVNEASKIKLDRNSTGWLHLKAELDFTNKVVDVVLTRISDNSVIYEGELAFADASATTFNSIYLGAGKNYGVASVDNVQIGTEKAMYEEIIEVEVEEKVEVKVETTVPAGTYLSFTDTGLTGNTEYTYKIAAVVDGKTSHMSRPLTIKTAVDIQSVPTIELENLVEGTPLAEGQTVADLLPATIKVVDATGATVDCDVTWDASSVDITKVGEYTVYASIKGQTEKYSATLTVEANQIKEVASLEAVDVIVGCEPVLPEKVSVVYTNTTSDEAKVTWDTSNFDNKTVGEYTLIGTITGFDGVTAKIKVNVIPNYIASVNAAYVEIILNATDATASFPETVTAVWGDGTRSEEDVTWADATIDTAVIGVNTVDGTIEGFTGDVKLYAEVSYPAVYSFDFGIDGSIVEEDDAWTVVTVNGKGGTKTMKELDVHYTEDRGYGFANPDAVFEGRTELFTYAGDPANGIYLPDKVFGDYAMPTDNFIVDLPNGKYVVELFAAVNNGSSTKISCTVEGTSFSTSTKAGAYGMGAVEVEVTDGQLDIDYTNQSLARTAAIIIREVELAKVPDSGNDNQGGSGSGDSSDDTTTDDSTDDTTTDSTTDSTTTDNTTGTTTGSTTGTTTDTTTEGTSGEAVKELVVDITTDWNTVMDAVEEVLAEADGDKAVLSLKLGAYNVIDKEVVDAVKGKKVTLRMEQENGIIWELNGLDVDTANDIDMNVLLGSDAIPADAIKTLAGDKECWGVSLAHNGEFGFTATMKVPFEAEHNGKFANLFYYNDKGEFEFMSSYEIADGYAEFLYSHASEYLIVISETAMTAASVVKPDTTVTQPEETKKEETSTEQSTETQQTPAETVETPEESGSNMPLILIIIAVIVVGAAAIAVIVMRKKKEEE